MCQEASTHPDLGNLLQQSAPQQLRLRKVKSHQDPSSLEGMDVWHSAGNNYSDLAAKAALKHDYGFLHDTVAGIAAETQGQKDLLFLFHTFLLELSTEEWRLKKERGRTAFSDSQNLALASDQRQDAWMAQYPIQGCPFEVLNSRMTGHLQLAHLRGLPSASGIGQARNNGMPAQLTAVAQPHWSSCLILLSPQVPAHQFKAAGLIPLGLSSREQLCVIRSFCRTGVCSLSNVQDSWKGSQVLGSCLSTGLKCVHCSHWDWIHHAKACNRHRPGVSQDVCTSFLRQPCPATVRNVS